MTAAEATKSFRAATAKRKGSAVLEDGVWTVVAADGHVWFYDDTEGWVRWTEDDDEHARNIKRRVA